MLHFSELEEYDLVNWKVETNILNISGGLWVRGIELGCCFGSGLRYQLIGSGILVANSSDCVGSSSLSVFDIL